MAKSRTRLHAELIHEIIQDEDSAITNINVDERAAVGNIVATTFTVRSGLNQGVIGHLRPQVDGSSSLGIPGRRWNNLYTNGVDTITLNVDSDIDIGGNLTVSGSSSLGLTTASSITSTGAISGNSLSTTLGATIGGNTAVTGNLTVSGAATISSLSGNTSITSGTLSTASGSIRATHLRYNSGDRVATDSNTANSIVARNGSGDFSARNITASLFNGTAVQARYADYAENYLSADTEPGTILTASTDGEDEVRAASDKDEIVGVVSTQPGCLINSDLEGGTPVALKGRVPVKVKGVVSKGDRIFLGADGIGITQGNNIVGLALESSSNKGLKLIEVVLTF